MNLKHSRFGSEFHYEILSIPKKSGEEEVFWHDAVACITPEATEEESLQKAWHRVQDLAQWLKKKVKKNPEIENFRIIVGWSKQTRERQGQIFKIWKSNDELNLITSSESLEEYQEKIEDDWQAPFKGWQKDVFQTKKESNQSE